MHLQPHRLGRCNAGKGLSGVAGPSGRLFDFRLQSVQEERQRGMT